MRLNASDLDEPNYYKVLQSAKMKLQHWQDDIYLKLKTLQEKFLSSVSKLKLLLGKLLPSQRLANCPLYVGFLMQEMARWYKEYKA